MTEQKKILNGLYAYRVTAAFRDPECGGGSPEGRRIPLGKLPAGGPRLKSGFPRPGSKFMTPVGIRCD